MIAEYFVPAAPVRVRGAGPRHRLRPAVRVREQRGTWARFWDDRQAIGLKVFLLAGCMLAAALLEAPW